jgi:hypothetical protein
LLHCAKRVSHSEEVLKTALVYILQFRLRMRGEYALYSSPLCSSVYIYKLVLLATQANLLCVIDNVSAVL